MRARSWEWLGALIGLADDGSASMMERAINPTLALLLYATFLGVPFTSIARSLKDGRFLGSVLALNFVIVPVVVFALTRFVASDKALLVGAVGVAVSLHRRCDRLHPHRWRLTRTTPRGGAAAPEWAL